jgi:hypothetical protein
VGRCGVDALNVLLVKSRGSIDYIPLGLLKASTYFKSQGHDVCYLDGQTAWFTSYEPDLICIASLFTWDITNTVQAIKNLQRQYPSAEIMVGGIGATLLTNNILKETGVKPKAGLVPEWEKHKPDYGLIPELNTSIGYTTRGCPNKCPFCMVNKLEPTFQEIDGWEILIDDSKPKIVLWDNNFLASSLDHFNNVMNVLESHAKQVDFNQGLDATLFNEYHAERFSNIRIQPLRFALDRKAQIPHIKRSVLLANEYGIPSSRIHIYALYNYKDTLDDAMERCEIIHSLGCTPFPMRYKPLDWVQDDQYISPNWDYDNLIKFSQYWCKRYYKVCTYDDFDRHGRSKYRKTKGTQ